MMDFKSALLRGLDHRSYRNSIMVAPQGRFTKEHVSHSRKGFKLLTKDQSKGKKLLKGSKKVFKVDRLLARPHQQNQVKREFKVKEFPIKVSELITYK